MTVAPIPAVAVMASIIPTSGNPLANAGIWYLTLACFVGGGIAIYMLVRKGK